MDSPYTTKRDYQFRGPQSSEDYNLRVEQNYKDLVLIYNRLSQLRFDVDKGYGAYAKEIVALARYIDTLESRMDEIESAQGYIGFSDSNQIDVDRFNSTSFSVNTTDRCTYFDGYGVLTLPRVETSSVSKIKYINDDNTYSVSPSLETFVEQVPDTADYDTAVIDTSQPFNAILSRPGRVWERNVITTTPDADGAQMYLYIRIPNDLSITPDTNSVLFNPFPMNGVDILDISYSTKTDVNLVSTETWTPLNNNSLYFNNPKAVGNVPPGGWSPNDAIINSGPKIFFFDPRPITALRIKMRQPNYFLETGKYVYSYGLSKLDIRYDKFLDSGKTIIRFDAPAGSTISNIVSVEPQIWNILDNKISTVSNIRTIWETSYNSGNYTTQPVPFSQRVWIELTLNKDSTGAIPALSNLILRYV